MAHPVPEMPGTKAPIELAQRFRYEVANLLGRKQTSFPGAQPVSFAKRHLEELQRRDYYVCEKSDGIRCLMYLTSGDSAEKEVVYLIDRKNDYYCVPDLHFPLEESQQDFHVNTVVDGELVMDVEANSVPVMRYLVFDCLVLDGQNLMHRTLDKRLAYFKAKVFDPYSNLYKQYPEEIQYLPFQVEFKSMEVGYGIEMMFKDKLPRLKHGNDGLIFTCRTTEYKFGTDHHILKWKSENENSIDFRMSLHFPLVQPTPEDSDYGDGPYPDYDEMPEIQLFVHNGGDEYIPYGTMGVHKSQWEDMKARGVPLNHRIVECFLDKTKIWRFMRFRDDKKEANHISTVESVIESITNPVSERDLIQAAAEIKSSWKKRLAEAECKSKQENEARKLVHAQRQTNGQNGTKRKLEGPDG